MKILVTGAAGFIGNHLVSALLAQGDQVTGLVRSADQAAALVSQGAAPIVADICDREAVVTACQRADTIYHCAAAVGHTYSKQEIYAINLGGVQNVIAGLEKSTATRLVYISSLNVLGMRHLDNADETTLMRSAGEPHADVKIDAERAIAAASENARWQATIVRPGLVYGPGEQNIPKLLRALQRGKFAFIGSRDYVTPMLHVDDLVRALLSAGTAATAGGRTYHVTDGASTTIGQMIDHLAHQINVDPPTKVLPYWIPRLACAVFGTLETLGLRRKPSPIAKGGLRFLATSRSIDISRARQELDYTPQIDYQSGLAETVAWINSQPHHEQKPIHTTA